MRNKSSQAEGETPPDDRAARAYIALVEEELAHIDFGDESPATPSRLSGKSADKAQAKRSDEDDAEEQLRDAARLARYDAILKQAVARWMMDSDWERAERAAGRDPARVSEERRPSGKAGHKSKPSFAAAVTNFFGLSDQPPSAFTSPSSRPIKQA